MSLSGGGAAAEASPTELNARRMASMAKELAKNALNPQSVDGNVFCNICISLARGVDYAVANNDKPDCACTLPLILKKVCQHRRESALHAAVMVLLISVKSACEIGWFSCTESEELLTLFAEVASSFCSPRVPTHDQSSIFGFVSLIMSRFHPWLKLGHVVTSLEVKSGFVAHLVDFRISKDIPSRQNERFRLLVARVDNIDTSSCIIRPKEVNFMINGKSVDSWPNTMDMGPQFPAVVDPMLRYGLNLLQVVGQFDGHYVILLARMSVLPTSELPAPPDYVHPACAAVDVDADIIEGPSRVKLTCPISFGHIKNPAKGHICKHYQCFDLINYLQINMKRPTWRCPHCNQSVCYTDIRIDQNMLKILQEVGENVAEVIISEDGFWKAVSSTNDQNIEPNSRIFASPQGGAEPQETLPGSLEVAHNIYDLTEGDDNIHSAHESIDTKPILLPDPQNTSTCMTSTREVVPRISEVNQISADAQVEGIFSSGFPSGQRNSMSMTNLPRQFGSVSGHMSGNFTPFPDLVSPAPNQEQQAFQSSNFPPIPTSQQPVGINANLQWQQSQLSQSVINDYRFGRHGAMLRDLSRYSNANASLLPMQMPTPNASLLPMQMPTPNASLSPPSESSVRNVVGNGSSHPAWTSLSSQSIAICSGPSRDEALQRQYILRPILHQPPASQITGLTGPVQVPHPISSALGVSQQLNHANHVFPSMVSRPPHLRSSRVPQAQIQPTVSLSGAVDQTTRISLQQYRDMASSAQQAALRTRQQQMVPVQIQTPGPNTRCGLGEPGHSSVGGVQTVTRMEDLLDIQAEQNWRPSGRMRGSLTGRANTDALSHLMIRPTQTSPDPLPNPVLPPLSQNSMTQMQAALLARRNQISSQPLNGENRPHTSAGGK